MRIISEFYHFESAEKIKLLVEGFKWKGNTPISKKNISSAI
jgi:hypothetical protein